MRKLIALLFLTGISHAGTITTSFSNSAGSVTISSQAVSAAGGAFTFIQSASASAATSTVSKAFTSNITAHSLIVVGCIQRGTPNTIKVSDNNGNTYSTATVVNEGGGGIGRTGVYYALNANAGATTVTCADITGTALWMQESIHEYGATASAAFDLATSSNVLTASTNPTGNPLTTTIASEFVFSFAGLAGAAATGQSGTLRENFVDNTFQMSQDTVQASIGAVTSTFTVGTSGDWIMIQAAFK